MHTMANGEPQYAGRSEKGAAMQKTSALSKVRRNWKWWTLVGVFLAAVVSIYWMFFICGRVSTDDAYVKADYASVSSRVGGTALHIYVENDTPVEAGDLLVQLDTADYRVALDAAVAVAARIEADIRAAGANLSLLERDTAAQVQKAEAGLNQQKNALQARAASLKEARKRRFAAEAELVNAKKEYDREAALFRDKAVSRKVRDDAFTLFKVAQSALEALDAEIRSLEASLKAAQQQVDQAAADLSIARSDLGKVEAERFQVASLKAQHKEASAQLEQARLNLSYTTIKAPIKGVVAQKDIQVGNRVQPGQPFMAVVPLHAVYAEANLKETELESVSVGQLAEIEVDAYPGRRFSGRVSGIRSGTGAVFALLPPQNASGNWIKVVQRVPVRIEFDRPLSRGYPLRAGLSLKVTVYTAAKTAPLIRNSPGTPATPAGPK